MATAGQIALENSRSVIPTTMLAAVYRGKNDVRMETVPVPAIGPGELLVRVHTCGICGTDLKKIANGSHSPPRIFGHETAGVVAAVGKDVNQFQAGDRVMVFPQGNFSVEAMTALRSRNFDAAVNTVPHPRQDATRLTLGEIAQPAVLRYGGFPLFLRSESVQVQAVDVAFNLFFGKPVLIVEHHDVCRHPEVLSEVAARINSVAPDILWTSLTGAVRQALLQRRTADGARHILAYSNAVRVANDANSTGRYLIEWRSANQDVPVEQILQDGNACTSYVADSDGVRVSIDLPAGSSQTLSVIHRNPHQTLASLGVRHRARAFVRRRLSEVRDNYLSRTPQVLAAAKTLQRCFLQ